MSLFLKFLIYTLVSVSSEELVTIVGLISMLVFLPMAVRRHRTEKVNSGQVSIERNLAIARISYDGQEHLSFMVFIDENLMIHLH